MSRKNLFIAFEGIDGSGKSTQVKLLSEKLQATGHKVHATFEPTDSQIGKMIRTIFSGKMEADHKVIAALFAAAQYSQATGFGGAKPGTCSAPT